MRIKKKERKNINLTKTLPKKRKGGNTSQIILQGQHNPNTKTQQKHYKIMKLQTYFLHKHRYIASP